MKLREFRRCAGSMDRYSGWRITVTAVALLCAFPCASVLAAAPAVEVAFSRETDFVDRLHTDSMESAALSRAIYDTLLYQDSDSGEISGLLAESWSWNEARDMVEFRLRRGVYFHDGEPLGADDVVYTVNLVADPVNNAEFRQRELSFGFIDRAEAVGDDVVQVYLSAPNPMAESIFATRLLIWPKDYTERHGGHSVHRTHPVGSGPYRVIFIHPGSRIELAANANYFQGPKPAARIERLIVRNVPDLQTQIAELLKGSLDFIWGVPADHERFLARQKGLTVTHADGARITFLSLDAAGRSGDSPLRDIRLRRAVAHAIDRRSIATHLMSDSAQAIYFQCHPSQTSCPVNPGSDTPTFSPETARQWLEAAGQGDGFVFEVMVGSQELRKVAEVLQWQLRQVGIDLTLRTFTLPAWRQKFMSGHSTASLLSFGADLFDVAATLPNFFGQGPADYTRDTALTEAIARAERTAERTLRDARFEDILTEIADQAYTIPLYTNPVTFVFQNELSYEPGRLPFPDFLRLQMTGDKD